MAAGYISEVFTSIEGEGTNLGRQATFLRLGGCNLSCSFCDTNYARQRCETATVDLAGEARELSNPIECDEVVSVLAEDLAGPPTIVVTGGEPLLQPDFVQCISRKLRMRGFRIHLETNGTLAGGFAHVSEHVDFVCMDVKLPCTQSGISLESEHLDFLRALRGKEAAVKIVITGDVSDDEVRDAFGLVAMVNPHLPVILQPAFKDSRPDVGPERLLAFQSAAMRWLHDVTVSIQLHKVLGIR